MLKIVGASGQLSLGKKYAGKYFEVTEREDGTIVMTPMRVIPESEAWLHTPEMCERLAQATQWMKEHPPVTIRGIDKVLDQALKTTAEKESRSINQLVIEVLKERFGLTKVAHHTRRYHDLDDFFGRWSAKEYEYIQDVVDEQRKVDPDLWS